MQHSRKNSDVSDTMAAYSLWYKSMEKPPRGNHKLLSYFCLSTDQEQPDIETLMVLAYEDLNLEITDEVGEIETVDAVEMTGAIDPADAVGQQQFRRIVKIPNMQRFQKQSIWENR